MLVRKRRGTRSSAYEQGRQAGLNGLALISPYTERKKNVEWHRGYNAGVAAKQAYATLWQTKD